MRDAVRERLVAETFLSLGEIAERSPWGALLGTGPEQIAPADAARSVAGA